MGAIHQTQQETVVLKTINVLASFLNGMWRTSKSSVDISEYIQQLCNRTKQHADLGEHSKAKKALDQMLHLHLFWRRRSRDDRVFFHRSRVLTVTVEEGSSPLVRPDNRSPRASYLLHDHYQVARRRSSRCTWISRQSAMRRTRTTLRSYRSSANSSAMLWFLCPVERARRYL